MKTIASAILMAYLANAQQPATSSPPVSTNPPVSSTQMSSTPMAMSSTMSSTQMSGTQPYAPPIITVAPSTTQPGTGTTQPGTGGAAPSTTLPGTTLSGTTLPGTTLPTTTLPGAPGTGHKPPHYGPPPVYHKPLPRPAPLQRIKPLDPSSFACNAATPCAGKVVDVVPTMGWQADCATMGSCVGTIFNFDAGHSPINFGQIVDRIGGIKCGAPWSCLNSKIHVKNTNAAYTGATRPVELENIHCEVPGACNGMEIIAGPGTDIVGKTEIHCDAPGSCVGCIVRTEDWTNWQSCDANQNPNGANLLPWQSPPIPAHAMPPQLRDIVLKSRPQAPANAANIPGAGQGQQAQQPPATGSAPGSSPAAGPQPQPQPQPQGPPLTYDPYGNPKHYPWNTYHQPLVDTHGVATSPFLTVTANPPAEVRNQAPQTPTIPQPQAARPPPPPPRQLPQAMQPPQTQQTPPSQQQQQQQPPQQQQQTGPPQYYGPPIFPGSSYNPYLNGYAPPQYNPYSGYPPQYNGYYSPPQYNPYYGRPPQYNYPPQQQQGQQQQTGYPRYSYPQFPARV